MRASTFAVSEALEERRLLAILPSGFVENELLNTLASPTSMAIGGDGRVFIGLQNGTIRLIKNDVAVTTPVAQLTVDATGERGLLGLAADPNFPASPYLYAFYAATSPTIHNRISRLTLSGDVVQPGSEVVLLELPDLGTAIFHMGGGIHFGPDEKLYVGVGDHQAPTDSQLLTNPYGKILRLNADGSIPTDNPFYASTTGINRAIWAYGLRNPYTSAFQSQTGRYFINDVGQDSWEEINSGVAGANYGWPNSEGATSNPAYRTPEYAYPHGADCAITGGDFHNPPTQVFPPQFTGKYFFMDFCGGWIKTFDPVTKQVASFATNLNFPNDMRFGPTGTLYYINRGFDTGGQPATGQVFRVRYTGALAPSIATQPAAQIAAVNEPVTFSVVASGQAPLSYQWLKNNTNINGATGSSYTLASATLLDNNAKFSVRITNASGSITSQEANLTVINGARPVITFIAPAVGSTYRGGDLFAYSASAFDADQGALGASAFTWKIDFHHNVHSHPLLGSTSGVTSGSIAIPIANETATDVFYRVHLSVTDSSGLTASSFRDVLPVKSNITLQTNIAGLSLNLDGQPRTLPLTLESVVGIVRTLSAPLTQSAGGISYEFVSWSDGGATTHAISTPQSNTTYVATYRTVAQAFVSDLTPISSTNGWGPVERDRSNNEQFAGDGRTLTLNGVTFAKGLGTHAASDVRYNLAGAYTRFQAKVGIDDEVGNNGSVIFQVFADGNKIFDSGVMNGASATQTIDVDITGKNTLQLVVNPNGAISYDHGDWADAKVTGGSTPPPPPPTGLFYPPTNTPTGSHAHGVGIGDFNGDGRFDVAIANAGSNTVSVFFGIGNGTFGTATNYSVGSEPKSVFVKDLNGDNKLDLISPNQGSNSVSVLINSGNGLFANAVSYGATIGAHEAFAGDFNGDNRPDIAVAGWGQSQVVVLLNSGTGTFSAPVAYAAGNAPHSVVGGDFNKDGALDLAVANYGSSTLGIFFGNGNGTFQTQNLRNVSAGPHSLRAGDLNNDGNLDLVTANEGEDNVSVLLGSANGVFGNAVAYATGSDPRGAAIGDVNNDARLDIITANVGGNYPNGNNADGMKISVLLGVGNGTFAAPTHYQTGNTPFAVALADFDADGDLDAVTANWHSGDFSLLKNTTTDVPPTNTAPIAGDDSAATTINTPVLITVLANDTDSDGTLNPATVTISTLPLNGSAVVDAVTGRITYTPNAGASGIDSFFYTVRDDDGAVSNPARVNITVSSQPDPGAPTYLSTLNPTASTNGWGPFERDRSNGEQGGADGRTITLNGVTYAKGLGTHAGSDIRYDLAGAYTSFQSLIGIDDEVGDNGSVIFRVLLDGIVAFDSGAVGGGSATQTITLNVTGKTTLQLVVDSNGPNSYDHADWADAKLFAGTPVPDNQAPTVPTNLRTTAIGSTSVALTWDASSDNVAVTGYDVFRNLIKVGSSAGTSFVDNNLTPATAYEYTVRAYDAATNTSTLSAPLEVTTTPQSTSAFLSDLNPISAINGWGVYERDRSNGEQGASDGRTITLNGVTYAKGLGTHAGSDIRYNLGTQYSTFQTSIGIDDEVGNAGSLIFQIYLDGVLVFDSGVMTGASATQNVSLNVTGRSTLQLVVNSNGSNAYDHANWADAKLN